jgi:hypothetical protein
MAEARAVRLEGAQWKPRGLYLQRSSLRSRL